MNKPGVELEAPLDNIDSKKYYLINLVLIRIPTAIIGIPRYFNTSLGPWKPFYAILTIMHWSD